MSALPQYSAYQGDTARLDFLVLDYTGTAQNLATVTLRWALSDPDEMDVPILEKAAGDGIEITDAAAGLCTVTIPAGELDTPGTFVHELEVTLAGGATYTYGQGPFIVRPTVYPT